MRLFVSMVHRQEPLLLPYNVEPRYDTTFSPSKVVNIDENRYIAKRATTCENDTTSSFKIFRLNYMRSFTYLLSNLCSFIQC